jgi:hypothetical protein
MSKEHLPRQEHDKVQEGLVSPESQEQAHNHLKEQAERARQQQEKSAKNLEKIREMAEVEAKESKALTQAELPKDEAGSMLGVQHSLKSTAYKRTLAKTQQKLPAPAKAFSRVTHNPTVDKISAVAGVTIARPSGILGGSMCAFLGSVILLYYSKHYGFRYNYLVLFILFIGGYLVGAVLELAVWFFYSRKQHY